MLERVFAPALEISFVQMVGSNLVAAVPYWPPTRLVSPQIGYRSPTLPAFFDFFSFIFRCVQKGIEAVPVFLQAAARISSEPANLDLVRQNT